MKLNRSFSDMTSFFRTLAGGAALPLLPGASKSAGPPLAGRYWIGVEASWTTDIVSVVSVFPPSDQAGKWIVQPLFWVPSQRLAEIERLTGGGLLSQWVDRGLITATEGARVHLSVVVDRIKAIAGAWPVAEVAYDRWAFRTQAIALEKAGIPCVEVPQTFLGLSAATKFLCDVYPAGRIYHGNNPVMDWMLFNCEIRTDKFGNCCFVRPDRVKSGKRVDGMLALANALSRALQVVKS